MVEGEGVLETVSGDVSGVPVAADVVDQHVNPVKRREYLVGKPPYLGLGGQVSDEHVDPPAACADLPSRVLGAVAVAAGDRQVRTHRRQAECGRPADATGATGDEHRLAGHPPAVQRIRHFRLNGGYWSVSSPA